MSGDPEDEATRPSPMWWDQEGGRPCISPASQTGRQAVQMDTVDRELEGVIRIPTGDELLTE